MSTEYFLVCDDCEQKVHAARWSGLATFTPDDVSEFLLSHQKHSLRFLSEHDGAEVEYDGYEEVQNDNRMGRH